MRRKKSHGEVTIMDKGKKLKDLAEQEYSHIAYKITPQGGIALPLDNRENAQMVEQCYRTRTTTINPIIDWTDGEVWEFLKEYKIPYCSLYDEGFKRLGCIGCPMGSREQREYEFERWPKYKNLYMIAFQKMIENRGGDAEKEDRRGTVRSVDARQRAEEAGLLEPNSRRHNEWLSDGAIQGLYRGGGRLYPYAKTRAEVKDFSEMTPQEVIDWWID